MPVEKTALLVPYRIVLGTRWGDLVVFATRFTATRKRASAPRELIRRYPRYPQAAGAPAICFPP